MKTLKTVLNFWQEIVFVIPLGILLIEMSTKYFVVFRQTIDIVCFCFFSILLICLVGHFFLEKQNISSHLICSSGIKFLRPNFDITLCLNHKSTSSTSSYNVVSWIIP